MSAVDAIVVGGGVMGCATALFLQRGGMRTALVERGDICRSASGTNAGTLTMHMTRAALIPYALEGWRMWQETRDWLGADLGMRVAPGLCLAFTDDEAALLERRSAVRAEAGAPIELIDPARAVEIEPGLRPDLRLAAYCPIDGHLPAYRTAEAFRAALVDEGCAIYEQTDVGAIEPEGDGFIVQGGPTRVSGARLVLAGGVWLEPLLRLLSITLPIKTLINQLVITDRLPQVMRSVITIANGLLSLKQFDNGTILIGGGWQGEGDRASGATGLRPDNLVGNVRLAAYAVPALRRGRIVRAWAGFEAETADAMPAVGPVPGVPNAHVIGSVHSGYTSGPYIARLLAEKLLGEEPERPLFPIDRLFKAESPISAPVPA